MNNKMFNNMEDWETLVSLEINSDTRYDIDIEDKTLKRYKRVKNSPQDRKETGEIFTIELTNTFDFYFDMNVYDNVTNFEQLCEVMIYKSDDDEVRTFYIRENENLTKLIDYIQVANCYIDLTNKEIKNELTSLFSLIKSLKSKYKMVEKLKVNGWDLSSKKYIRNKLTLFKQSTNDNVDKWKESVLYLLENEECVSLLTTFKIMNFIPYNSYPYAVNVYGTHDTGKTTCEEISQSFFNKPLTFTYISEASIEEYRRRSKNYFLSFDESQLQGDKTTRELVYGLANGSRRQTQQQSRNGWDLKTDKNESSLLLTLVGEREYVSPTEGGDKDRIYKYQKKKPTFSSEEQRIEYSKHIKRFHIYKNDNYGMFLDDLIEFLESKAEEIENKIPELNGTRREEFVQFFNYIHSLSKEFFKKYYDVDMCDVSHISKTFIERDKNDEVEGQLSVLMKLETLIKGFDNRYVSYKERFTDRYENVGFVSSPLGKRTIYFMNKTLLKQFFENFNVNEIVFNRLFEGCEKRTSTTFNGERIGYILSIEESMINSLKEKVLKSFESKDIEIVYENIKKDIDDDLSECPF